MKRLSVILLFFLILAFFSVGNTSGASTGSQKVRYIVELDNNKTYSSTTNRLAETSKAQAPIIAELKAGKQKGVVTSYRSLWIVNAIGVIGDSSSMDTMLHTPGVTRVVQDRLIPAPKDVIQPSGIKPLSATPQWGVSKINADDAWVRGVHGRGVTIGFIDTGVKWDHPALQPHYRGWYSGAGHHHYNWFDAVSGSLTPVDTNGHGTHVVGIAVGGEETTNPIGIAPGAKFISARACDSVCYESDLLQAIQFMLAPTNLYGNYPDVTKAPRVINFSLGENPCVDSTLIHNAIKAWVSAGQIAVFGAGNSGPALDSLDYPACYQEGYAVGATNGNDVIWSYSSRGDPLSNGKPDLVSPGVDIYSSVGPGNGYAWMSGTSMAAPSVAGAVALLLELKPSLSIAQVRSLLKSQSVDLGTVGWDTSYGAGRTDVYASINRLIGANQLLGPQTCIGPKSNADITACPYFDTPTYLSPYN